jgi:hypothetical protein
MRSDEMLFVARFDAEPYDVERRHVAPPKHEELKLRCFLIPCSDRVDFPQRRTRRREVTSPWTPEADPQET